MMCYDDNTDIWCALNLSDRSCKYKGELYHKILAEQKEKEKMWKQDHVRIIYVVIVLLVIFGMYIYNNTHDNIMQQARCMQRTDNLQKVLDTMTGERNAMSRQHNDILRSMGQLECKMINLPGHRKVHENGTTSRGGYCYRTVHFTFDGMVTQLAELFTGKTVGSFGDGLGEYKKRIMKTGKPKLYDAYDGAPLCENQSNGTVTFLDLAVPQYGLPLYDWVISIEVAEHIPKQYEHIYIDNLVRHAKEGIVNSWAIPGQSGFYHINEHEVEYVKTLFRTHGFEHDSETSSRIQKGVDSWYLKRNTNVYRRVDGRTIQNLSYHV